MHCSQSHMSRRGEERRGEERRGEERRGEEAVFSGLCCFTNSSCHHCSLKAVSEADEVTHTRACSPFPSLLISLSYASRHAREPYWTLWHTFHQQRLKYLHTWRYSPNHISKKMYHLKEFHYQDSCFEWNSRYTHKKNPVNISHIISLVVRASGSSYIFMKVKA